MNLADIDIDEIALEDLGLTDRMEKLKDAPSNHYTAGVTSSVEDRALALLGAGVNQQATAAALGVTESRISQLLSGEAFASKVSEIKYAALTKHNERDSKYDTLEDSLLTKLEGSLGLLIRPMDITKVLATVNNCKRRGNTTTNEVTTNQNIVNIILPTVITEKFTKDINNQVIKVGDQELLTIASGELLNKVQAAKPKPSDGDTPNVPEQSL